MEVTSMATMTHRERVLAACNLEKPDRVPLDFGSTIATTIIEPGYNRLKALLGLEHENRILLLRQGSVIPDDSMLERFDIDTRCLLLGTYQGGPAKQIDENTVLDIWHTTWQRAPEGHYINIDGPFQNAEPSIQQLEDFTWPDPDNEGFYDGLRERAAELRNNTDCAIVFNLPVGIVHQGQFMRGFMEWLTDLYQRPDYTARMSDIIADIWIRIAENSLDLVGELVDVVAWGDDIAMQQGPFVNPDLYREIIKPRHKRMIEAIKRRTDAKLWYHSCGSVYPMIKDLIEIGVDILNPIQVAAKDMDPALLKREFGQKLCFWGAIDTQHLLPFGSPDEVRQGVRNIIDCMAAGGGYVLTGVHNIQKDVPAENIVAMFDEARSYGVYS
jgi:uroporphyrinogen decarboxylase